MYVSGEESGAQIALRARRLALDARDLQLLAEIQLEKILGTLADAKPEVAVIDSIQTVYSDALTSAPGSVAQVRECAAQLTRVAKQTGVTIVLVGHVTKEGALAGPRVLEHIVDTVLYFEGDTHSSFRLVRAFKNRFGAVNELGVFAMTDKGLKGVSNPSALFLSQHDSQVPGSCVLVTQEGTRPLLVEIQALVDASARAQSAAAVGRAGAEPAGDAAGGAAPACRHRRLRPGRVRQCGGRREDQRAGGRPRGAARDRSSLRDKPLPRELVVFGEVGLAGEIRPAPRGQERLREAAKLGFSIAHDPEGECAQAADRGPDDDRGRAHRGRAGAGARARPR